MKEFFKKFSKRRLAGWSSMALFACQYLNIDPIIYESGGQVVRLTMVLALIPLILLGKDAQEKFKKAKG